MTVIEALILGLIQGVTEFLPISSSGHLELGQIMLGMKDLHQYLLFDLVCHLGTLLALLWVMRSDIRLLLMTKNQTLWLIALAIAPLVPCYFLFHSAIKTIYSLPQYLGFFFLFTSAILFLGEKYAVKRPETISAKRSYCEAIFIGCAQAIAIVPGISRSASTMSAAKFLGWERDKAARFSFLLSIPTISGAIFLEILKVVHSEGSQPQVSPLAYFSGFISSLIIGGIVLQWFLNLLKKKTFKPFAWYCLFLGIITLFYVNFLPLL